MLKCTWRERCTNLQFDYKSQAGERTVTSIGLKAANGSIILIVCLISQIYSLRCECTDLSQQQLVSSIQSYLNQIKPSFRLQNIKLSIVGGNYLEESWG